MIRARAVAPDWLPAVVVAVAVGAGCRSQPPVIRGTEGPSDVGIAHVDSGPPSSPIDQICVGEAHSCALLRDGSVACWGDNGYHQVSVADVAQLDEPAMVDALPKATRLRCGTFETCVLTRDGRVDCLGRDYHEETRAPSVAAPDRGLVQIALPAPARDLALENGGGCAILMDRSVACWLTSDPLDPFLVDGIRDATAFASAPAQAPFVCLTRAASDPACIEFSGRALTHPETGIPRWVIPLPAFAGAQELLVSDIDPRVCARDATGQASCIFIRNQHQPEPPRPFGPGDPLSVGSEVSCARRDGAVRCESILPSPLTAGVPADLTTIALSRRHACALVRGHVECWGEATHGQLGDGTRYVHPPEPVPGVDDAVSLAAGKNIVCAGRKRGGLTCWGESQGWHAPTGSGTIDIPATDPVDEVAFGSQDHPCLRRSGGWVCRSADGTWRPKGKADDRVDPIFAEQGVPTVTLSPDGVCGIDRKGRLGCFEGPPRADPRASLGWADGDFVQVASPFSHYVSGNRRTVACARTRRGTVRCFRVLEEGPRLEPMDLPGVAALSDVTSLAASTRSLDGSARAMSLVCAVTRPGGVFCWGDWQFGQLGGGPSPEVLGPVRIDGLPPAVDLALGGTFGCARGVDGRVYCWGSNREGGAPDGAPREQLTPVPVRWPVGPMPRAATR
jgi:hypothetical protein